MTQPLPTGAYIIRNKNVNMVLRMCERDVSAFHLDSHRHREEQIWWIEPLPEYEDELEDGGIYTISIIPRSFSIDAKQDRSPGAQISVHESHGELWQEWRIKPVKEDTEDVWNGGVIDIPGDNPPDNANCASAQFVDTNPQQRWEFLIPLVDVPAGWIQI
ncbi:hypothetical protein RUND412_004527 [Rhizina undulata]